MDLSHIASLKLSILGLVDSDGDLEDMDNSVPGRKVQILHILVKYGNEKWCKDCLVVYEKNE